MPRHFLLEKEDRIATLTFHRSEKRNPLNEDILLELDALLCRLRDDADGRVLIFTGSGNTFCAGVDLSLAKGVDDPRARSDFSGIRSPSDTFDGTHPGKLSPP